MLGKREAAFPLSRLTPGRYATICCPFNSCNGNNGTFFMEQRLTSFAYRVGQLRRLVLLLAIDRITPLGPVGKGQIPFLAELFQGGDGVSQEELAEKLHFDKGSAARSLAKLEAAGLVARTVNPRNRRQMVITLTPDAEKLRAPFLAALRELTETMVRGFSAEEREQALGILDRMISNVLAALGREAK